MSTGTSTKPTAVKDVIFLSPDQVILNRKWNGRWSAVQDEIPHDESTSVATALSTDKQVSVRAMADSIKENGQLEDVLVYEGPPDDNGNVYRTVAGQTRVRAIALLNQDDPSANVKVRCKILPKSVCKNDQEAFLLNEEENRITNRLTLLDKAYCMQRERDDLGYTAADIAKRWDCSVPAVAQALTLVDLPTEVQQAIYDKAMSATDAISSMKPLHGAAEANQNAMKEVAKICQDARVAGNPVKSGAFKELVRKYISSVTPPPAPGQAQAGTDANGTNAANGTATASPPEKKKPGRKADPNKKVPRGLSDLRNVLKGREGVISQAIVRYLEGFPDMTDEVLINLLNSHEFNDDDTNQIPIHPRTEGAEAPTAENAETPAGAPA